MLSRFLIAISILAASCKTTVPTTVSPQKLQEIFNEVKTPYKYGVILSAPDSTKMADSPTIFRIKEKWYMTYIIFDGKGYETWLAESDDLLQWKTTGKLMSFTDGTWDASQKAGYPSLIDIEWGGTYEPMKYDNQYWMSYLGGSQQGYEAGRLGIGMSATPDITKPLEVGRLKQPVLSADDSSATWYDNKTIFKSSVIADADKHTGHPFVMYYNAAGEKGDAKGHQFESIAMAVSDNMIEWKRFGVKHVITRERGICGDAQIVKINDLYVMFYFGFNWQDGNTGAFDRFACSYDLVNWTEWQGPNLVEPSEPYDKQYAHKPWMIKWKGVVYHFYNAVGTQGRVIALATSKDLRIP